LIFKRLLWVFGLLLAIGGSYLLYQGGRINSASVWVVETSRYVPAGTELTASNLMRAEVPPAARNTVALQNPTQLLGKVLMVPLPQGQQVLPNWLASTNLTLGHGYVDLPLPTSVSTSAVGTLQAGEKVSLLWMPSGLLNQQPTVEFQQDPLVVLAVRDAEGNVEGQATSTPGVSAGVPAIVDLRVTTAQAIQIEGQAQNGKLIVLGIQQ